MILLAELDANILFVLSREEVPLSLSLSVSSTALPLQRSISAAGVPKCRASVFCCALGGCVMTPICIMFS